MNKLENGIRNVLLERGAILDGWKMKITSIEPKACGSDWAVVSVTVTKPRCRKPFMGWELAVYMPKDQIHFDKSSFAYL